MLSVSNISRQRKGQNEDREKESGKEINLGHIPSSVLPQDLSELFP